MTILIKILIPKSLRPFKKEKEIDNVIESSTKTLINLQLISQSSPDYIKRLDNKGQKYQSYLAISNICETIFKRFYIVINTILATQKASMEDIQGKCKGIATNLKEVEGWIYSEFLDATKFKPLIDSLVRANYIEETEGLFSSKIKNETIVDFNKFVNKEFREVVNQINFTE